MRNTEKLEKLADTLEWVIEEYPDLYDQSTYGQLTDCGTKACIAGWAAFLNGWKPQAIEKTWSWDFLERDSEKDDVHDIAIEVLGITRGEAEILFDQDWEPAEGMTVPDALKKLAGGEPIENVTIEGFEV